MCGIFGYVGARLEASQLVLAGLKKLEYRGYDSWGIASRQEQPAPGRVLVEKHVGKIGQATTLLVKHLEFDRERILEAASDPALLATDVAEQQVLGGKPFRRAHEAVGRQVRDGSLKAPWSAKRSLAKRDLPGAPHPRRVKARARAAGRQAAVLRSWAKKHPPPLPL